MSAQPTDPLADGIAFSDLFAPPESASGVVDARETVAEGGAAKDVLSEGVSDKEATPEVELENDSAVEVTATAESALALDPEERSAEEEPPAGAVVPAEPVEATPSEAPVSEDEDSVPDMIRAMDKTLAELTASMETLRARVGVAKDEEPRQVMSDRALPPASPESAQAAREDEAREAAAREAAAREAASEAAAEAAGKGEASDEAAAREAAAREAAAREAAAREVAAREAAASEAAAREAAAREAAAREAAAREAAAADDFPQMDNDNPFAALEDDFEEPAYESTAVEPFGELEPLTSVDVAAPSDFELAADEDAVVRVSPSVTSAADINEYEPAYAELEEEEEGPLITGDTSWSPADEPELSSFAPDVDDLDLTEMPPPTAFPAQTAAPDATQTEYEPVDILWAVANVDLDAESAQQSQDAVRAVHAAVGAADVPRKKQKVKLDALPFEALVSGTPLIATIFSPSGGVGKSSTAMNLAVYIAATAEAMAKLRTQRGEQNVRTPRVLVLDGDIVQGSLALRLKGDVTPSIHTLMLYLDDRAEAGFVGQDRWPSTYDDAGAGEQSMRDFVMWPDILPNLNLLAAPDEPDLFFDFGPNEYREILQLLSRFYDVIIIDSGTEIVYEATRAWLGHANEVFLVTAPEVDRIYNAYKAARYIATARPHPQDSAEQPEKLPPLVTPDKLSLIMTRYDMDSGLEDIDEVIDKSFPWLVDRPKQRFYVPDVSREMTKANNSGGKHFLVLENQTYAKVIGKLAKHMFARYQEQRQRSLPPQT